MTSTTSDHVLSAEQLRQRFDAGATFDTYVATGNEDQQRGWRDVYDRATLDSTQQSLVQSWTRSMNVIVSSGVWCGDCVQQGPLIQRIADANDRIQVRWLDRDQHLELAEQLKICGGLRVPVAVFMAEDFEPVSIYGDRTLTRYRAIAARQLGAACQLPGAPLDEDELRGTLQDWLQEFERVALLLRLSGRLRQKHGD